MHVLPKPQFESEIVSGLFISKRQEFYQMDMIQRDVII